MAVVTGSGNEGGIKVGKGEKVRGGSACNVVGTGQERGVRTLVLASKGMRGLGRVARPPSAPGHRRKEGNHLAQGPSCASKELMKVKNSEIPDQRNTQRLADSTIVAVVLVSIRVEDEDGGFHGRRLS